MSITFIFIDCLQLYVCIIIVDSFTKYLFCRRLSLAVAVPAERGLQGRGGGGLHLRHHRHQAHQVPRLELESGCKLVMDTFSQV